jgi:enamine deaminase RidA (YjgF/YER057c/UK114 family)
MSTPRRQRHYSSGPWERRMSYSRATRVGDHIYVSGCTAMKDGEVAGTGDPVVQIRQALETIRAALEALGSSVDDVVRYRIYLTRIDDWQSIGPEIADAFRGSHPAGTLVAVSALIHPDMLVEIEVDAIAGSAEPVS